MQGDNDLLISNGQLGATLCIQALNEKKKEALVAKQLGELDHGSLNLFIGILKYIEK